MEQDDIVWIHTIPSTKERFNGEDMHDARVIFTPDLRTLIVYVSGISQAPRPNASSDDILFRMQCHGERRRRSEGAMYRRQDDQKPLFGLE